MSAVEDILLADSSQAAFAKLNSYDQALFNWQYKWLELDAHKHQIEPAGDWWSIWLMLAGRGAGKTRAAAETLSRWAWDQPGTRWLVSAPTSGDLKGTCFEGDSGLIKVIPPQLVAKYNSSLHELHLKNGSFIKGIPASEPERFRGPQFHGGWLDELAAWEYLQESWDMIQFGIRLGSRTKLICSTTPKPKETILDLIAREGDDVVITRASTYSNINNLAPSFKKQILSYEGTNLGRQEIHAEIIDPEDSGIVKRDWFKLWPHDKPLDGPMAAMLVDCWQDHLQYPDLRPKVVEEYKNVYGTDEGKPIGGKKVDLILIEDKSAGISLIQDLQRAYLPVQAYNPGRADKTQRLSIIAPIIKSGRVWVPESSNRRGYVRDWAEGCISQICAFPDTVHDDFCDAAAQGLRYLRDGGWLDIDPLPQYDDDDYLDETRKSRGNPYAQ